MTSTQPPRTAAANAARMRKRQERLAAELRGRGWTCHPPELVDALRADLTEAEAEPQGSMQGYEIDRHIGYIEGLKHALTILGQK